MRPRRLYELSHELRLLLEKGLRSEGRLLNERPGAGRRIPVLLCHPLDPLEPASGDFSGGDAPRGSDDRHGSHGGTVGVLYPLRIVPEPLYRQVGLSLETGGLESVAGRKELLRRPGLWVRVRYAFLVSGGSLEDQLGAMEAALSTLHDHPCITLKGSSSGIEDDNLAAGAAEATMPVNEGDLPPDEGGTFPLRIVEDPEGWRELGLSEHRLTISFEVALAIPSFWAEAVERVLDREVSLEEGAQ